MTSQLSAPLFGVVFQLQGGLRPRRNARAPVSGVGYLSLNDSMLQAAFNPELERQLADARIRQAPDEIARKALLVP
jgi:hypothetical protein